MMGYTRRLGPTLPKITEDGGKETWTVRSTGSGYDAQQLRKVVPKIYASEKFAKR